MLSKYRADGTPIFSDLAYYEAPRLGDDYLADLRRKATTEIGRPVDSGAEHLGFVDQGNRAQQQAAADQYWAQMGGAGPSQAGIASRQGLGQALAQANAQQAQMRPGAFNPQIASGLGQNSMQAANAAGMQRASEMQRASAGAMGALGSLGESDMRGLQMASQNDVQEMNRRRAMERFYQDMLMRKQMGDQSAYITTARIEQGADEQRSALADQKAAYDRQFNDNLYGGAAGSAAKGIGYLSSKWAKDD